MHRGRPTAGQADAIALQGARSADRPRCADGSDDQAGDALASARPDDGVPGQDLTAGRTQGRGLRCTLALLAQIDDRHIEARCPEIGGSRIGGSARCGDHRTPSRRHAVAIGEHAQALGQHDAGTIVVGEDERALVRARRQHDLGGAHLPQTLARQVGVRLRKMVRHPLHQADVVVIVVAEGRRARQQGDVVARAQSGKRVREPRPGRCAVDGGGRLVQQGAAHLGLLVGKDDPLAALRRRQRRSKTGRAGADHQHVAVRVRVLIAVGIGRGGGPAEACRGANPGLVELVPEGPRPHEGLVVEAGDEKRRQHVVDRPHIEAERRPMVLRADGQAVDRLDARCPIVRIDAIPAAVDREQRVWLLGAVAEDAARPVILERTADEVDAIGQQRRRHRVAGVGLDDPAVEPHGDRLRAIDAAVHSKAEGPPPPCGESLPRT